MTSTSASSDSLLRVRRSPPLRGVCRVPGDKSISHRALLFGALCDGSVTIRGLGTGGDNRATAEAMRAMGVEIEIKGEGAEVQGVGLRGLRAPQTEIDCGNSGTSIRLLMGLLAGQPFSATLVGDASLSRRPMGRVALPLMQMGASIQGRPGPGETYPPLVVQGGKLKGIRYDLPVASAQLKTALVLAGLQAEGPTTLREPGLSRDHTERMLGHLGAPIVADAAKRTVRVDPMGWDGKLRAMPLLVPGDLSSAAFILVAASIVPGSDVVIENVGLNPTRSGVVDVLCAMGADLDIQQGTSAMGEPVGTVRVRAASLRGVRVEGDLALRALDEVPILAVAAACASGPSTFADLGELRVKESDRIASVVRELSRAGVAIQEAPEGFTIEGKAGGPFAGGDAKPDHDHRIAMASAVLGLLAEEETRIPKEDIGTSFPGFASTLSALAGR